MKELLESLNKREKVRFLLDTCFLLREIGKGRTKELERFCEGNDVGMSSFNLLELEHVVKKMPGPMSRHVRDFLKKKIISNVLVPVVPGDREGEKKYVQAFDPKILGIVSDPSDAVMFVLALKIRADVLTRDRAHVFTAAADNYSDDYGVKVINKLP